MGRPTLLTTSVVHHKFHTAIDRNIQYVKERGCFGHLIVKVYKYIANQRRVKTLISNICMNKLRNTNNTESKVTATITK